MDLQKLLKNTSLVEEYELCTYLGMSNERILSVIASTKPITIDNVRGRLQCNKNKLYNLDLGRWPVMINWIGQYVPQWEAAFRKHCMNNELITLPDAAKVTENVALALGINQETLQHYIDNQHEIDAFLDSQRALLGTMAELALFKLIATGDPTTVRWLLSRMKPAMYGEKVGEMPKENKITIIDVEGAI